MECPFVNSYGRFIFFVKHTKRFLTFLLSLIASKGVYYFLPFQCINKNIFFLERSTQLRYFSQFFYINKIHAVKEATGLSAVCKLPKHRNIFNEVIRQMNSPLAYVTIWQRHLKLLSPSRRHVLFCTLFSPVTLHQTSLLYFTTLNIINVLLSKSRFGFFRLPAKY